MMMKNIDSLLSRKQILGGLLGYCGLTSARVKIPFISLYPLTKIIDRMVSLYDLTAVDYPQYRKRFLLCYNILSFTSDPSRFLYTIKYDQFSVIPSLSPLSSSALWLEREIYDLFGIFFEGHSDLRRILTDYGFEGHPLRKDFPLTGFLEIAYSLSKKTILFSPIELPQELRLPASFQPSWINN